MNTKDRWKFMGSDVPRGMHPEVDGQRCYLFRSGPSGYAPLRQKWLIIPVAKFVANLWGTP